MSTECGDCEAGRGQLHAKDCRHYKGAEWSDSPCPACKETNVVVYPDGRKYCWEDECGWKST